MEDIYSQKSKETLYCVIQHLLKYPELKDSVEELIKKVKTIQIEETKLFPDRKSLKSTHSCTFKDMKICYPHLSTFKLNLIFTSLNSSSSAQ